MSQNAEALAAYFQTQASKINSIEISYDTQLVFPALSLESQELYNEHAAMIREREELMQKYLNSENFNSEEYTKVMESVSRMIHELENNQEYFINETCYVSDNRKRCIATKSLDGAYPDQKRVLTGEEAFIAVDKSKLIQNINGGVFDFNIALCVYGGDLAWRLNNGFALNQKTNDSYSLLNEKEEPIATLILRDINGYIVWTEISYLNETYKVVADEFEVFLDHVAIPKKVEVFKKVKGDQFFKTKEMVLVNVKVNKNIDDSIFSKPKGYTERY